MPLRNLSDWLDYLESLHPRGQAGIELGLERVRRVSETLRQKPFCPVITVGGTNGKGSTCALLESILLAAGYHVGVYASPHLLSYNERVRIDGKAAEDAAFCDAFARVAAARGEVPLTYFEFGTLAAWEMFAAARPDVIVLEVGLGGRLDATNVYDADCAIVTSVALDHMEYLGPTRDAIGREKAGICRPGRPLICGDADPPPGLVEACRVASAEFRCLGRDFGYERQEHQWRFWNRTGRSLGGLAHPALRGASQLGNASCAIAALDALHDRLPVSAQDIRRGLADVALPGRCQVLPGRPQIVLDVAHNPAAAEELAHNLGTMGYARRTWAIFGCMADKDTTGVVAALHPRVECWLTCDLPGPRAATAAQLAEIVAQVTGTGAWPTFASPGAAFRHAQENAGPDDRILVFGSFLTVAGVMHFLQRGGG